MTFHLGLAAPLLFVSAPLIAQTSPTMPMPAQTTPAQTMPGAMTPNPAPIATATPSADATAPAAELTAAEQKTLDRCMKMGPGQAAQSSKCSAVMTKAGKGDPAKERGPVTSEGPR